jgi:multidrug resistance efflux pump
MDAAPHPLDQLIEQARAKLATAEREFVRAERNVQDTRIEVATLEMAKAQLLKNSTNSTEPPRPHTGAGNGTRRPRSLSDSWQQVLRKMDRRGEADYDDIRSYCGEAGLEIERESLRTQMWVYVNRKHFLVSPRQGVFRLTAEGREAAGIPSRGGDASTKSAEAP